jgi:hypothetical protein
MQGVWRRVLDSQAVQGSNDGVSQSGSGPRHARQVLWSLNTSQMTTKFTRQAFQRVLTGPRPHQRDNCTTDTLHTHKLALASVTTDEDDLEVTVSGCTLVPGASKTAICSEVNSATPNTHSTFVTRTGEQGHRLHLPLHQLGGKCLARRAPMCAEIQQQVLAWVGGCVHNKRHSQTQT